MLKKILILVPLLFSSVFAADYLLAGVDIDDKTTYYDFDKVFDGSDDVTCWFYSAANVLQSWQDKQSDAYISLNAIPDGNTITDAYVNDIVSSFLDVWGDVGGWEINAFEWWLKDTGTEPLSQYPSYSFPEGGAYWSDYFSADSFIGQETSVANASTSDVLLDLMDAAIFNDYGMTLGIYKLNASGGIVGGHAITLWGYGYDDLTQGYYVYVTDSDDKFDGMVKLDIVFNEEDNNWYFANYYSSSMWYLDCVTTLEAGPLFVPEPSTASLSLLALSAMLLRRRRARHLPTHRGFESHL